MNRILLKWKWDWWEECCWYGCRINKKTFLKLKRNWWKEHFWNRSGIDENNIAEWKRNRLFYKINIIFCGEFSCAELSCMRHMQSPVTLLDYKNTAKHSWAIKPL